MLACLQTKLVLDVDVVEVGSRQEVVRQHGRVAQALHRAVDVARVAQVIQAHQAVPGRPFVIGRRLLMPKSAKKKEKG